MKSSGHPKLKRRTPSPPPSSRRERERGEHSERRHAEEDANAFPTTLLVRNLSHETSKPRGFGFVKFRNAEDAAEAKRHMNNQIICGNQISVVFSKEDPKRPEEMLAKNRKT
ncbi:serine/arginine-rich SC35-like splicing factor SCL28 isoform X2 [Cryptomeria japonica]|uniref:serine/arginine-rich SC35-like splicing factor SCL28 isoform X2 n=1 Tax=Cryptomeria japonica TaxID=3369 RepID=UPI0025AC6898|nr:serine/arginine-rich SC35-like splicing factor SCL28 isoform X2 [Cryptomeria japonica]